MNWDDVWELSIAPAIEADSDISSVMGDAVYLAGTRAFEVPSLTGLLIVDTEEENWAPADWQLDVFASTMADVRKVSRALRRLFHRELQVEFGPFKLWCQLIEGRSLVGPEPDEFYRYSMDFRFTPGRSLYLTAQES